MIGIGRRDPARWLALAGLALFGVAAFAMPTAIGAMLALAGLGLAAAVAFAWPVAAMAAWLILVETTPEMWLSDLIGHHELIIAILKSAGLAIAAIAALRSGARFDRFNPSWAFVTMFGAGLIHGLWPGLTLTASFRSLIGSSAPFAPGFLRMTGAMRRTIVRCIIVGPCVTVGFGTALAAFGVRALWLTQQGAIRLVASSSPAFLGGFAMIAIFAGLVAFLSAGRLREWGWVGVNFAILLASGARAPLVLAVFVVLATLVAIPSPHLPPVRRAALLAIGGAGFGAAAMAASALHMIRAVDLVHLGEAWDLSNRNLIWPDFISAIARSPVLGWGVGAGKVIVGLHSPLGRLLGTNAAHNEYLRIAAEGGIAGAVLLFALLWLWLRRGSAALPAGQRTAIRLVFLAFAVQSFTDNTLIATTSLAFFTWARAVFSDAEEGPSAE